MLELMLQQPESPFSMQVAASETTRTVHLAGDLDLCVRAHVETRLDRLVSERPETLVVDLSRLTFMDSSGVHTILGSHRRAEARGVRLILVPASERVQRVFSLCGVERLLPFAGHRHG